MASSKAVRRQGPNRVGYAVYALLGLAIVAPAWGQFVASDTMSVLDIREARNLLSSKMLLVIGGEDRSVGQYILNEADHVVSIPQFGRINSLNASVAAGIALFSLQTHL